MSEENRVARGIVEAGYQVHVALGPGLLESVYEAVLARELLDAGFSVSRQVSIPVVYKDMHLDEGFRADLIVDGCVIVELKSVVRVEAIHAKQLLTYLRLSRKRLGLLVNFNETLFKNGVRRIVNGLPDQ